MDNNGTVSYSYNDVGLRTNMTVTGQNTMFYRYDNANWLTNVTRTKFTAREDDGTGLYYYRARYYDAALDRFVSEDPFGMVDGPNLYKYAQDDPVTFTDPLGLIIYACARTAKIWFAGSVGGEHWYFWDSTKSTACGTQSVGWNPFREVGAASELDTGPGKPGQ